MTIPDKALVLQNFDADDLTVDEIIIFQEPSEFSMKVFKEFLLRFGNWTASEVGKITMREMREVIVPSITAQINKEAVPLAS